MPLLPTQRPVRGDAQAQGPRWTARGARLGAVPALEVAAGSPRWAGVALDHPGRYACPACASWPRPYVSTGGGRCAGELAEHRCCCWLRSCAVRCNVGRPPPLQVRLVLTIPALWPEPAKAATRRAANRAGANAAGRRHRTAAPPLPCALYVNQHVVGPQRTAAGQEYVAQRRAAPTCVTCRPGGGERGGSAADVPGARGGCHRLRHAFREPRTAGSYTPGSPVCLCVLFLYAVGHTLPGFPIRSMPSRFPRFSSSCSFLHGPAAIPSSPA
jgi:hypothetical protein